MIFKKISLVLSILVLSIVSVSASSITSYTYNNIGCLEKKITMFGFAQDGINFNRNYQQLIHSEPCRREQVIFSDNSLFRTNVFQSGYVKCQLDPQTDDLVCSNQELKKFLKQKPTINTYNFKSQFVTRTSCCGN